MILNRLLSLIFNEYFYILILKGKLLPQGTIYAEQKILRIVCTSAAKNGAKGGCYLMMYGLLDKVFTLHKFASSKGTGERKPHPGVEHIPVIDQDKLDLLRGKFIQVIAFIEYMF
ncbi:hypothetical protein DPMN_061142 [Dreissena polymorpha]|uniref:Uncharacterized protein n=1 Tax=Dreissena polymorpha TaxID=45954 RepID=A0A9D4HI48_DREPO|nr:hypothetical protein DPMN_061142 [Dreissena polymorpha]